LNGGEEEKRRQIQRYENQNPQLESRREADVKEKSEKPGASKIFWWIDSS
jgi:hypothetical protein